MLPAVIYLRVECDSTASCQCVGQRHLCTCTSICSATGSPLTRVTGRAPERPDDSFVAPWKCNFRSWEKPQTTSMMSKKISSGLPNHLVSMPWLSRNCARRPCTKKQNPNLRRLYSFLLFIAALWIAGKLFARAGLGQQFDLQQPSDWQSVRHFQFPPSCRKLVACIKHSSVLAVHTNTAIWLSCEVVQSQSRSRKNTRKSESPMFAIVMTGQTERRTSTKRVRDLQPQS